MRPVLSKGKCRIRFTAIAVTVCLCLCSYASAETSEALEGLKHTEWTEAFDGDYGFEEEFEDENTYGDTAASGNDFQIGKTGEKNSLFNDLRFTFSQHVSCGTKEAGSGIVTNRSSVRCELDTLVSGRLFVKYDGRAYLYYGNDHIAEAEEKDVCFDEETREFYIQASFDRFMIKAGKQVVVWGETDGDVVNDVISPRDRSEFIFIDLEESRLGQYMASVNIYPGCGDFFMFVTFRPEVNRSPATGTRYYRAPDEITIREEAPDFSDSEAGVKWKNVFGKFEIALMAASLLQNEGVLEYESRAVFSNVYDRYLFSGIGASYTTGSFLLKTDASFKKGYSLQSADSSGLFIRKQCDVSDVALGIEYDANGRYMLNFEFTNRHIFDYTEDLYGIKRDNTGFYFQFNKTFISDTLELQYSFYHQFQENNSINRTKIDYSVSDDIELTTEYVFFRIRDLESYLWNYRNEDRISAEIKYYF